LATTIEELTTKAGQLLEQANPSATEIRDLSVEIDDAINAPEFTALPYEARSKLQAVYQELRSRLRTVEQANAPVPPVGAGQAGAAAGSGANSSGGSANDFDDDFSSGSPRSGDGQEHNAYAEQLMQEAEKFFYGGRYAEAIKTYDQVLQIEPAWDRALQHRNESENYLRTGHIPSVALPAEAATAFGKAQSAARLGRYSDAMALLIRAQNALRQMGIQRWQEGQEFEQKLQQNIDAENVFEEGLTLFRQGSLEEAIDRVETAARATGLPKYNDRAEQLRKAKDSIRSITETFHAASPDLHAVIQAKASLDALGLEFGDNPALTRLKARLETILPQVVEPLKEEIRALKSQAERAETLQAAQTRATQARQIIEQARSLGTTDETLLRLQSEVDHFLQDTRRLEDELQQSVTLYHTNPSWPAAAARLSQVARSRFPNDPGVLELNRDLAKYNAVRTAMKVAGGLVIVIIVGLLLSLGYNKVQGYLLSLTPTATATATPTATGTATVTPIPTITNTPRPTAIPSATPTPQAAKVARLVWVRNGCYENFQALGKVPAGATVRLMPMERRFDSLSRECLMVNYSEGQTDLTGWILIADLTK
jgi:tetratricopeptide (TPR) repeat protein